MPDSCGNATSVSKQKLIADVKLVIGDAEELLRATADQTSEKVAMLRDRAQERLQEASSRLGELETVMVDKSKAACHAAEDFINEQPMKAVGIAAVVGLCIGLLIGRR